MKQLREIGIILILLLILPVLGVTLAGESVGQYLEFPPLTKYVKAAPFSWTVFMVYTIIEVIIYGTIVSRLLQSYNWSKSLSGQLSRRSFPWWGWLTCIVVLLSWFLAWSRFSWFASCQRHTFIPLWFGYVIIVNALCYYRSGRCMMLNKTRSFILLFIVSAVFWWYFEFLNRFVQNWYYVGIDNFSRLEYVIFATLSFSTVLPAVLGTNDFLRTFPVFNQGLMQYSDMSFPKSRNVSRIILFVAALGLFLLGVLPNLLYPLLWVSPLLIIISWKHLRGYRTILDDLEERGDWRNLITPAVAALICGFFWEMWNVYSLAKWEYAVPYLTRFRFFEMPILGYAGYLPFGLECLIIGRLVMDSDQQK